MDASLRLKLISREERLIEGLHKIISKLEEADCHNTTLTDILCMTLALRDSLDGSSDHVSRDGSLGRLILAHDTLNQVLSELEGETERRLALEIRAAQSVDQDNSLSGSTRGHSESRSCAEHAHGSTAGLHRTPQMTPVIVSSVSADEPSKEYRAIVQLTKERDSPTNPHAGSHFAYNPNFSLTKSDQPILPSW